MKSGHAVVDMFDKLDDLKANIEFARSDVKIAQCDIESLIHKVLAEIAGLRSHLYGLELRIETQEARNLYVFDQVSDLKDRS